MANNDDLGKSELQKQIEKASKNKAVDIEKGSYKKTKSARMKLEEAANKQKGTTNRMRMINENLKEGKKSGVKTYKNAKLAREQATELNKEKNMFNPFSKTRGKIEKWQDKDTKAEAEIKEIENQKDENENEGYKNSGTEANIFGGGSFKEEEQTNKELMKILQTTKEIEKETAAQSKEGKKQKKHLEDIEKTAEHAKKEAEKATKKLDDDQH